MDTVIVFPFITFPQEFKLGEFFFWRFRKSKETHISDVIARRNVERFLGIYKELNGNPIQDCTVVSVSSVDEYRRLQDAILAVKYVVLSMNGTSEIARVFDDHFYHDEVVLESTEAKTFVLYDRTGLLAGATSQTTGRFLPGSLRLERITNFDQDDLDTAMALYQAIEKEDRVKHSLSWYCKSVRWQSDQLDNMLALCIAFETFTKLGTRKDKKKPLMERTRRIVFDSPYVSRWVRDFYKKRNTITHSGSICDDNLVYRDRAGNKVLPHHHIARTIFQEAIRTVTSTRSPSSELEEAVLRVMKSDRVLGGVISNRCKLERLRILLDSSSLSQRRTLTAMSLCSMVDDVDLSLTAEQISEYITVFSAKLPDISDADFHGLGSSIRTGLKNVLFSLHAFLET